VHHQNLTKGAGKKKPASKLIVKKDGVGVLATVGETTSELSLVTKATGSPLLNRPARKPKGAIQFTNIQGN